MTTSSTEPRVVLQELATARELKAPVLTPATFWRTYVVMAVIMGVAAFYPRTAPLRDALILGAVLVINLGAAIVRDCTRAINRKHAVLIAQLEKQGQL